MRGVNVKLLRRVWGSVGLLMAIGLNFALDATAADTKLEVVFSDSTPRFLTDDLLKIDPHVSNPHERLWYLSRSSQIEGLKVIELSPEVGQQKIQDKIQDKIFGVEVEQVRVSAKLYFRSGTQSGVELQAREQSDLWLKKVREGFVRLTKALSLIRLRSEKLAETSAGRVLWRWQDSLNREWEESIKKTRPQQLPPVESTPHPIIGIQNKVFARAPAKIWNGMVSVHVSLDFGTKELTGNFLVDTGAARTLISPTWLESPGFGPLLLKNVELPPIRIETPSGQRLAKRVKIFDLKVGGRSFAVDEALVVDTELFYPPKSSKVCCDGVLGVDALRLFPVEFSVETPSSLIFYEPIGFFFDQNNGRNYEWIGASLKPNGNVVSECESPRLGSQVRWDTGAESVLSVHRPSVRGVTGEVQVECDGRQLVRLPHELVHFSKEKKGSFASQSPAMTIGMEFLRGQAWALDLPHGKIWFDRSRKKQLEMHRNISGISLVFKGPPLGDRTLSVSSLDQKNSQAKEFAKRGLKVGSQIHWVNDRPADEIDEYELKKWLVGERGEILKLGVNRLSAKPVAGAQPSKSVHSLPVSVIEYSLKVK